MANTQDNLPFEDIKDGLVILKDGGAAVIIQTSAVNFGLLSAEEQIAIIGSFAQMINSLSFPIQITILSKRLDISAYLKLLEKAQTNQTNPLLSQMMIRYRRFIQSLIKDNEVLDKQFYITVPLSYLELGVGVKNSEDRLKKAKTVLDPKRDQIIRQLNRVGLTAKQLNDEQLIKFFFEIYNPPEPGGAQIPNNPPNFISLDTPQKAALAQQPLTVPQVAAQPSPTPPPATTDQPVTNNIPQVPQSQNVTQVAAVNRSRTGNPFVVEELRDNP